MTAAETLTADWPAWMDRITLVCGMTPGDRPMLASWAALLSRDGHLAAEAIEATEWVALHDPQPWRPNLLAAIAKRLDAQAASGSSEAAQASENESCAICGGLDGEGFARTAVGRVIVPDPTDPRGTKEVAVYCRCPLGRYFRASAPNIKVRGKECRVLTIDDVCDMYTLVGPAPDGGQGWRGWVTWRQNRDRELRGVSEEAREADRRLGPLSLSRRLARAWRADS
jgi:hypothetical protein